MQMRSDKCVKAEEWCTLTYVSPPKMEEFPCKKEHQTISLKMVSIIDDICTPQYV